MSWTYSENPASSKKDQVRFLIGDTDSKDPLLSNEEITYILSLYNNAPMNAAIRCCETIVSKFSRLADETVGQVSVKYSQIAQTFMKTTMPMLRARLAMEDSSIYAGGISNVDKQNNIQDRDRVRPDFSKHMMENYSIAPWTTENDYEQFLQYGD